MRLNKIIFLQHKQTFMRLNKIIFLQHKQTFMRLNKIFKFHERRINVFSFSKVSLMRLYICPTE